VWGGELKRGGEAPQSQNGEKDVEGKKAKRRNLPKIETRGPSRQFCCRVCGLSSKSVFTGNRWPIGEGVRKSSSRKKEKSEKV